jgi:hypothetical protein
MIRDQKPKTGKYNSKYLSTNKKRSNIILANAKASSRERETRGGKVVQLDRWFGKRTNINNTSLIK